MTIEKRYKEEKIRDLLLSMGSDFTELTFMWEFTQEAHKSENDYLVRESKLIDSFNNKLIRVYWLILVYLEELGHSNYLDEFKSNFKDLVFSSDPTTILSQEFDEDSGHSYSTVIGNIWAYLTPFSFSSKSYLDRLLNQTGLEHLERILRNTQVILNKLNAKPNSEPQVYNSVKFIVQIIFTSSVEPSSGFFKCFKKYNPDILIPEILTAVEYKYADTEQKLKTQFDEVAADTKGYTGDTNYEIFYAVFYVTEDFWGVDKFNHAWTEMKFPENWKGIYVVGKK